ncbi:hypothetical protein ACT3TH_02160 [Psychrobacter sp. AOP22-C1-C5]|uniref:hypothetical protein n=1 Tax=Psychrobacter sp. AOP22-C1-C5 TaxID=3457716 RepID=UPI00403586B1
MKLYSILLLAASITLVGCQTTKIVSPETTLQDENTMTMKADVPDSDGDGVSDDMDECPATPEKVTVDERGCPFWGSMSLQMEYRAFFPKGSSELLPEYQVELDKIAIKMKEHNTATMRIEGSISK